MTDGEIGKLLAYMRAIWPNLRQPEGDLARHATLAAWQDILGNLDYAAVRAALAASNGPFAPSLGELRERVYALRDRLRGDTAPTLDAAWVEVNEAVRRVGSYGVPEWSHPAIKAAVDAMGWREYCWSEVDDRGVWAGQFRRFYEAAVQAQTIRPLPPALEGFSDSISLDLSAKLAEVTRALP